MEWLIKSSGQVIGFGFIVLGCLQITFNRVWEGFFCICVGMLIYLLARAL